MKLESYIKKNWKKYLKEEFKKEYFLKIENFINCRLSNWKVIYPKKEDIFNILNLLELENIKVVIIWQDPYFKENQAHWLSFSVPEWTKIPPSLKNIFKEMGKIGKNNWNLEYLVKQWVFLLNSILTVEKNKPASHWKIWWEKFTNEIIKQISNKAENIIFLLWWNFAKSKAKLIDKSKHFILETSHPSPLWSYRWFIWSKCFDKTNKLLKSKWKKEINW